MLKGETLNGKVIPVISLKKAVEALEKELIRKAMQGNHWVVAKAARQLDITERILSYKIKKYQIRRLSDDT